MFLLISLRASPTVCFVFASLCLWYGLSMFELCGCHTLFQHCLQCWSLAGGGRCSLSSFSSSKFLNGTPCVKAITLEAIATTGLTKWSSQWAWGLVLHTLQFVFKQACKAQTCSWCEISSFSLLFSLGSNTVSLFWVHAIWCLQFGETGGGGGDAIWIGIPWLQIAPCISTLNCAMLRPAAYSMLWRRAGVQSFSGHPTCRIGI